MKQQNGQQGYSGIDLPYIFRSLWKNAFIIMMCACITGMVSYVFLDNYQKDSYTVSAKLSVIARDNSTEKIAEYGVDSAVTGFLNLMNSDILKSKVEKSDIEGKLSGEYNAVRVGKTNIIVMQATSTSALSAYRLLKTALETYPSLSSYFDSGYMVRILDDISVDNIVTNYPLTFYYAVCAALVVLLGGVGLTVCMCYFTDKIHSKEQAEAVLDLDILGVQHYIKKKSNQKAILVTDKETDISYIEEMDKLVTKVREKMDAHNYRVMMVTSINENEGKSTTAANIALSLARRGKKVLLIDADLRRPAMYKIFEKEVDENRQLSQYLDGMVEIDQILETANAKNGVNYILQNNAIGDPDRLLEGENFKNLLSQMCEMMDYVIVDTPPMGIVRDAEIVAGFADAAILTLKQDYVRGTVVNDSVDLLEDACTTVIGGVLTMSKGEYVSTSQRSRYGKYYYGYGSRKE